ncbi:MULTISPECIES: 16S rRNA (guanine(527)-N(7))-methyltransferase RsmG [unclassified Clostridium]|uniref:16S rRNA (guanine(527)-N(7))-methyltransferase RsmG n=1 Tax=unclassified Clostridium TaxID=2614128 RepID=UPI000297A7F7|nr:MULTISPECIES: 16S rRNA (guanine(527)-N(7))-methyltransferase RsmG [unclassified Clostridium]EKQ57777.1 MAG: rRNA small subunit methyltransferase G [Clostridium sp. Maddingley MBC34-26]
MNFYDLMCQASEDVGIQLSKEQFEKFTDYMKLLQEWNEKINLTAIIEDEEIIKKHFIDSIKSFKRVEIKNAGNLIDVGTGAGFPGLPIAIMKEDIKVTLLDSLNKRINFLNTVITTLGLSNVTTIHSRAEDGARDSKLREKFDVATSRAVANMSVLSEFCLPYVRVGGSFIALKGPAVEQEINQSLNAIKILGGELANICEVHIEGTELRHNLVVVKKVKECPKVYPRKAGLITKNPIK